MSAEGGVRTIGILGAGKSGIAIARRALAVGYRVRMAASGSAARTGLITDILAPGASAVAASDVADGAELVVLAVPLRRFRDLPLDTLAESIVVDVMNYWPPTDGILDKFENTARPSSVVVSSALPASARLVKTLNHIGYHEIEGLARPAEAADRIGVAVAGDDPGAVETVAAVVDDLGFTPVIVGSLRASTALQPGSPIFGADLPAHALRATLVELTAPVLR